MKKAFLSLMVVAALAFAFTSCDKTTSESTDHTQTFTFGETSHHIDNAITIENIQDESFEGTYNAIVLSHGDIVGNGGEGAGIVIVFNSDINSGTYNLSYNPESPLTGYPKYFYTELTVTDIVDFNIEDLMEQDGVYVADEGSFTLSINDGIYTITTSNIEVAKVKDISEYATSSVDYEGSMLNYELADVEEGTLCEDRIVTAGATSFVYVVKMEVVCFITEAGDMLGFTYTNEIPTGTFENREFVYVKGMDINNLQFVQADVTIEKNNNVYTVDIPEITLDDATCTMHYVGTLPFFDFPF